jgi:hypothetical protein
MYALTAKRAELSGLMLDLERQAAQHKAELVHLDATLRLFDPDVVPALIRPKGRSNPNTLFASGELSSFILGVIREDVTATSHEVAERMMERKGMDVSDRKTRHAMHQKRLPCGRSLLAVAVKANTTASPSRPDSSPGIRWRPPRRTLRA